MVGETRSADFRGRIREQLDRSPGFPAAAITADPDIPTKEVALLRKQRRTAETTPPWVPPRLRSGRFFYNIRAALIQTTFTSPRLCAHHPLPTNTDVLCRVTRHPEPPITTIRLDKEQTTPRNLISYSFVIPFCCKPRFRTLRPSRLSLSTVMARPARLRNPSVKALTYYAELDDSNDDAERRAGAK